MSRAGQWVRRAVLLLALAGVIAGVVVSLRPSPIVVEAGAAVRGPLVLTVDAAGRTRMAARQTLSAPVPGELVRIPLQPGDAVAAGQVVAEILPVLSPPLDARTRAEVTARLRAARAGLIEARRQVARAEVARDLARSEADRTRRLVASQSATARALELALAEEKTRSLELELARASVARIRLETEAVAASLIEPGQARAKALPRLALRAASAGVVLRVHMESAGPVESGTPLLDLGDPKSLEFVVELPTQAAVRVRAGAAVRIDSLGDGTELSGEVKRVEPGAFTKISALGVEEQRVLAIVTPAKGAGAWPALGDGFAADAHIEVFRADAVLKVPAGAVFRHGRGHAVFAIRAGLARLVPVTTGQRTAAEVEIKTGLTEGSSVVVHPSDKLADAMAVVVE